MASSALVRPARTSDPPVIGSIQARAWRSAYGGVLPESVLAALTPAGLTPAWREAVMRPPGPRHGVFVAVADDLVVGFASVGPSQDRDATAEVGSLGVLAVDPGHQRAGHGSRLLSAAVDHLRQHGMGAMTVWVPQVDTARAAFFVSAGMQPDGARRSFAAAEGTVVVEIRYAARIGEPAPAPDGSATAEPSKPEPSNPEPSNPGPQDPGPQDPGPQDPAGSDPSDPDLAGPDSAEPDAAPADSVGPGSPS